MNLATIDRKQYEKLLRKTLPTVIHDEDQLEEYTQTLEELDEQKKLTREERELADLLTLLIEDYESRQYPLPSASPVEVLQELMEARELRQRDLLDVFATESIVSEVLKGKRQMTVQHIQKLSQKFHVSPEVFIPREA